MNVCGVVGANVIKLVVGNPSVVTAVVVCVVVVGFVVVVGLVVVMGVVLVVGIVVALNVVGFLVVVIIFVISCADVVVVGSVASLLVVDNPSSSSKSISLISIGVVVSSCSPGLGVMDWVVLLALLKTDEIAAVGPGPSKLVPFGSSISSGISVVLSLSVRSNFRSVSLF